MNHHVFVYVAGTEDFMTDQANPVLPLKSEKGIKICVDNDWFYSRFWQLPNHTIADLFYRIENRLDRGVNTGKTAVLPNFSDTLALSQSGGVDYAHHTCFVSPKISRDYAPVRYLDFCPKVIRFERNTDIF